MPQDYESDGEVFIEIGGKQSTELNAANGEIASSINVSSMTSIAGSSSRTTNLNMGNTTSNVNRSQQNALSNQQRLNQLNVSVLGKTVNKVANFQPKSSRSEVLVLTDNSMAETIADLKSAVEAFKGGGGSSTPRIPEVPQDPSALKAWIKTILECLLYSGKGRYDNPLEVDASVARIYLKLGFELGLKGIPESQVDISGNGLQIRSK